MKSHLDALEKRIKTLETNAERELRNMQAMIQSSNKMVIALIGHLGLDKDEKNRTVVSIGPTNPFFTPITNDKNERPV